MLNSTLEEASKLAGVLITGSSGLLGDALLHELQDDHELHGTYLTHRPRPTRAALHRLDIRDADGLEQLIRAIRPSLIIHCAALTDLDSCDADPELARSVHVDATRVIAKHCAGSGARLVHISTDAVYGDTPGVETSYHEEDEPTLPANQYGLTKRLGEIAASDEFDAAGADENLLILRTNFFGIHPTERLSFAEWILRSLQQRDAPVRLLKDVHFSPLLVSDLAAVIREAMARGLHGIYNAGASDSLSKLEFGTAMAELFDLPASHVIPTRLEELQLRAPRTKNMRMRTTRLARALSRELPPSWRGLQGFHGLVTQGKLPEHKVALFSRLRRSFTKEAIL